MEVGRLLEFPCILDSILINSKISSGYLLEALPACETQACAFPLSLVIRLVTVVYAGWLRMWFRSGYPVFPLQSGQKG